MPNHDCASVFTLYKSFILNRIQWKQQQCQTTRIHFIFFFFWIWTQNVQFFLGGFFFINGSAYRLDFLSLSFCPFLSFYVMNKTNINDTMFKCACVFLFSMFFVLREICVVDTIHNCELFVLIARLSNVHMHDVLELEGTPVHWQLKH